MQGQFTSIRKAKVLFSYCFGFSWYEGEFINELILVYFFFTEYQYKRSAKLVEYIPLLVNAFALSFNHVNINGPVYIWFFLKTFLCMQFKGIYLGDKLHT